MEDPTIMCITFTEKMFTKSREKKKKMNHSQPQGLKAFSRYHFSLQGVELASIKDLSLRINAKSQNSFPF